MTQTEPEGTDDWRVEIGTVQEATAYCQQYIRFANDRDYAILFLWCAQTFLRPILPDPCCVYLAFHGPKSAGKTKALYLAMGATGGIPFSGGTDAAILRTFTEAHDNRVPVGIDEYDSVAIRNKLIEGIIRAGNHWNASYRMSIPIEKGKWEPVDVPVGGPKAFTLRGELEEALATRTYVIEVPRQGGARIVIANLFPEFAPVLTWLRGACDEASSRWSAAQLKAHMKSEAFMARLDAMNPPLPRDMETASVLLAMSDVLGWDMEPQIAQAVRGKSEYDSELETYREALSRTWEERGNLEPDWTVPLSDVLQWVNEYLKSRGLYALSPKAFAKVYREFGFEPGKNVRQVRAKKGNRYMTFDAQVAAKLGVGPDGPDGPAPELAPREPKSRDFPGPATLEPSPAFGPGIAASPPLDNGSAVHPDGSDVAGLAGPAAREFVRETMKIVRWQPGFTDGFAARGALLRFQIAMSPENVRDATEIAHNVRMGVGLDVALEPCLSCSGGPT